MHYPPTVVVVSMPCTSGIKPTWVLHALHRGFDGVFIAADGEECAYLSDCAARSARIAEQAQSLMTSEGLDGRRLRMAAICSVCAEQFTQQVRGFAAELAELAQSETAVRAAS